MKNQDTGADPLGNGLHRMFPSGDIVTTAERIARLSANRREKPKDDCFGLSWEQIERLQGGKLTR